MGNLEQRQLGNTGFRCSVLGLGGAYYTHKFVPDEGEAVRLINRAIDLGINYLDTAAGYTDGDSERRLGMVVPGRRDEIFLATKSSKRTKAEAAEGIRESLKRLRVDHVDLLQVHAVTSDEALEAVFAPGGAMEAFREAKEAGLCRFLGMSNHFRPRYTLECLRRFPFDTVLIPLGLLDAQRHRYEDEVIPAAQKAGAGIIAMKVVGSNALAQSPLLDWSIRYVLSLPVSTALVGVSSVEQLEKDAAIARDWKPLSKDEWAQAMEQTKPLLTDEAMSWKKPLEAN